LGRISRLSRLALRIANLGRLDVKYPFIALMPQWDFLNFLSESGKRFSSLKVLMSTEATDLIRDGERITGVRTKGLAVKEIARRWSCSFATDTSIQLWPHMLPNIGSSVALLCMECADGWVTKNVRAKTHHRIGNCVSAWRQQRYELHHTRTCDAPRGQLSLQCTDGRDELISPFSRDLILPRLDSPETWPRLLPGLFLVREHPRGCGLLYLRGSGSIPQHMSPT
jgi:hypothetical protein